MCLLKVYLETGSSGKKLIAQDVSFILNEKGRVTVKDIEFNEISLENVEISVVDALNSVLVLKRKGED